MPGLDGSLIATLMSQLMQKATAPGVNAAASTVPVWSAAPNGAGDAPTSYPMGGQSGGGMTDIMKGVLNDPRSYGTGQPGMGMRGQLTDAGLSAGATAALTPVLGPAAPIVGPMVGDMGTKAMGKGPRPGGQQQPPSPPPPKAPTPFQQPNLQLGGPAGGGQGGDQYSQLIDQMRMMMRT